MNARSDPPIDPPLEPSHPDYDLWLDRLPERGTPGAMYDRRGRPITMRQYSQLCNEGDEDYRRIAWTQVTDGIHVSTVWLGLDHGWAEGPPLIFETMVFVKRDEPLLLFGHPVEHEGTETYRWHTEEGALAGHDRVVAELRAQLP